MDKLSLHLQAHEKRIWGARQLYIDTAPTTPMFREYVYLQSCFDNRLLALSTFAPLK